MQLTVIFIMSGMIQANGATDLQHVTMNYSEVTIGDIFKAIKIQTGYDVLWQPNKLDTKQKVNANFNSIPIAEVIQKCIKGKNLIFEIHDQSILIKAPIINKEEVTRQDSVIYIGEVTDEDGNAMAGATVKIIGGAKSTFTNPKGKFAISGPRKGVLEITYLGYVNKRIVLNDLESHRIIKVKMMSTKTSLGEVTVVSNGYQDLPKERATGSFEHINKEQLEHSSDPNLVKRLEGITTSMDFNNQLRPINSASSSSAVTDPTKSAIANLTIRGKNTLNTNLQSGQVLVVIDGVPSPYPIDNVNPNDVEDINILKDAAAASVWGSKAANGVIVIKTKRGAYNKPVGVSFSSNVNITEKPDLFYNKVMSTSDYIDAQVFLFNASKPNVDAPSVSTAQPFLSPVFEILGQKKNGQISDSQATAQLNVLRGNDIRNDFEKYILRNAVTQSYSLGIDGGSKNVLYRVFGGYDKNLENSIHAADDRLFLSYNMSLKPFKNLQISAGATYTVRNTENQDQHGKVIRASTDSPFYPYTRLVDDQGNNLSIPYKYRPAFINLLASSYGSKIQDLSYNPLNDINQGYYNTTYKNLNFNVSANYTISHALSANLIYAYGLSNNLIADLSRKNSFYMRDLVTYYTNPAGTQAIPNGGLYTPITNNSTIQSVRAQLNLNQQFGQKNLLNMIAGTEVTQSHFVSKNFQYYGYDENTLASNNQLDFKDNLTTLYANGFLPAIAKIPYTSSTFTDGITRTIGMYANGAYTYNMRYTISGSIRKDMSSDFGVGTNKGGAPYFSIGGKWNLSSESFYNIPFLPILLLRATYGYNGNVNPQVSARPVITYASGGQNNGLPYATPGADATNEQLRPEKTGVLNLGLDFGLIKGRISGSIEYYNKRTTSLIAANVVDPSTGFNRLTYNTADMDGKGIDFSLNTQNIKSNKFTWNSSFLFSYNRVKVVKLYTMAAKTASDVVIGTPTYNVGADLTRLYAYRWAGLDPLTGDPRGYINGQPIVVNDNNSYATVTGQPLSTAHYFGSAVPVYYGSLRNTFRYGSFSVSANILYKLGYYFRRPLSSTVQYSALLSASATTQPAEYTQRWQKPGDETFTNVPSQVYPANSLRDIFYQFSEINVQKADHVRLQEINLSYFLSKANGFLKNPRVFANITNLGVIWRANKLGLDPDINDYPNPKTYSFGFSANF